MGNRSLQCEMAEAPRPDSGSGLNASTRSASTSSAGANLSFRAYRSGPRVAAIASRARAEKLVHVSGIIPLLTPPTSAAEGKERPQYYERFPRRR